jgi:hypothetical protein
VNLAWDTKAANLAKMWEIRRQGQAVTGVRPCLSQEGLTCHRSQVTGGGVAICACHGGTVTGDNFQGTVSLPPFQSFSSHFTPVQPLFHTLRTSFQSLRSRQAS